MRLIIILFCLLSSTAYAETLNLKILGFTTHNYKLKNIEHLDKVYYLDDVEILEDQLSSQLSQSPLQAEKQVKNLMKTPQWKQFEYQLINAYEGVARGWELGIMKIPAILFLPEDKDPDVIYGVLDVSEAIKIYQKKYGK